MQSRVICNSMCGVKINIMGERPLVAIGRKVTDRIHGPVQFSSMSLNLNCMSCQCTVKKKSSKKLFQLKIICYPADFSLFN